MSFPLQGEEVAIRLSGYRYLTQDLAFGLSLAFHSHRMWEDRAGNLISADLAITGFTLVYDGEGKLRINDDLGPELKELLVKWPGEPQIRNLVVVAPDRKVEFVTVRCFEVLVVTGATHKV